MKKALLSFVIALVAALACCGFSACGDTHDEITGTWAVVYRFVDEEGNAQNEFVNGEYVVFTEKTFTFYKQVGDEYVIQYETPVSYHYGTGESSKIVQGSTDLSLSSLNRYSSYYFTLEKYGSDTDLGLEFFGTNCMTLGRYMTSGDFAVLIRCDNLGDTPSGTALNSINGNWVFNKGTYTIAFDVSDEQFKTYSKENVNGYFVLKSDWGKSNATIKGVNYAYSRTVYTFLYAEKDYIVIMNTYEYKTEDGDKTAVSLKDISIYFRNNV